MQSEYQLKAPETEEEYRKYYEFRYNLLRKPWDQPVGSEKDEMEDQSFHRMIVDKDGIVVGVGRLHFNTEKESQIRYLAVNENIRNQGFGSKIVAELEKIAQEKGAKEVMLVSREGALDFYARRGYRITKDAKTLFGTIKHKEMRKVLVAA